MMEIARAGPLHLALVAIALCLVNGISELQADLPAADDVDLTVPVEGDEAPDLQEELDSPFHRIRNLAVTFQSQEHSVDSRLGCQDICAQNMKCASFSFRARDNKCLTSPYGLDYDAGWALHLKDMAANHIGIMRATGEWTKFTSVKFVDPKLNGGKASSSDEESCKQQCGSNDECGAYSYNSVKQQCYLGNDGITFDPDYSYYERNDIKDAMPEKEAEAAEEGVKLPENQDDADKLAAEKAKPRIAMPNEAASEAKLAAYSEKIKEINDELESPNAAVDVDPQKEHATKEKIREKELERQMSARRSRKLEDTTFKLHSQTHAIEDEIRSAKKEGQQKLTMVAKQAFNDGYRKAAANGKVMFEQHKAKLQEEFKKELSASGGDVMLGKKSKAAEGRQKQESFQKFNDKARAKETKQKDERRQAATLLGRKVSDLVRNEGAVKAQQKASAELAEKNRHNEQTQELATKASERDEKSLQLMKSKGERGDEVQRFELQHSIDVQKQADAEIVLAHRQKKYEAEEKRRADQKQKQIEETSGVRERAGKDEKEAGVKEAKVKQLEMKAAQDKLAKLEVPSSPPK